MMAKVGETHRIRCFFVESKVGKSGLTVTMDYTDPNGTAVTGLSASAGAVDGEYYYLLKFTSAGMWFYVFKTATATVDQQQLPGMIEVTQSSVYPN